MFWFKRFLCFSLILLTSFNLVLFNPLGLKIAQANHPAPAIDIVFPVDGSHSYGCDFGAPRSGGRTHKGTDIFTVKGTPLVAAVSGLINEDLFGWQGTAGYRLWVEGADGNRYFYAHLNNDNPGTDDNLGGEKTAYAPGITAGVWVEAGQVIGYAGDSGNAESTKPHLHFEVHPDGNSAVCPIPSLKQANSPWRLSALLQETNFNKKLQEALANGLPKNFEGIGVTRRFSGQTSHGTAVAISQAGWSSSKVVILARDDYFSDALAGVPLAYAFKKDPSINSPVPLLLTSPKELSPESLQEMKRLGTEIAIVLGGPGAIQENVLNQLRGSGITPDRIWQNTAEGTASDIGKRIKHYAGEWKTFSPPDTAIVATSLNFQDSLSISSPAASNNMSIFLTAPHTLSQETSAVLKEIGIKKIIIVGGGAVVSANVEAILNNQGYRVLARFWGATEYDTSVDIASRGKSLFNFANSGPVFITRGDFFTDGLAGGPLAAKMGNIPTILVKPNNIPPATKNYLVANYRSLTKGYILGGYGAISYPTKMELNLLIF